MQLHELLREAKTQGVTTEVLETIRTLPLIGIVGPSGAGKTDIVNGMVAKWDKLKRVVTTTSRDPRKDEKPDIDYHFLSHEDFSQKIGEGMFLEHDEYSGAYYGTGIIQLAEIWAVGEVPVLNFSLRGIAQFRPIFAAPQVIFIDVTDVQTLRRRILKRTPAMTETKLRERLNEALSERANWQSSCDVRVVNDDGDANFDRALKRVLHISRRYVFFDYVTKQGTDSK